MTSTAAVPDVAQIAGGLQAVAGSLSGIAATVGREAADATDLSRRAAERARETAALAQQLVGFAAEVEQALAVQSGLLVAARNASQSSADVIAALAAAAEGIGSISAMIAGIAGRSRLLALNARIEAARSGDAGRGFDVVANEMKSLSQQTWDATRDIEDRTATLQDDVFGTRALFDAAQERTSAKIDIAGRIASAATRQSAAASEVAALTACTVEGIEDSAQAIGRVASAAISVDLLARQVLRAAGQLARPETFAA